MLLGLFSFLCGNDYIASYVLDLTRRRNVFSLVFSLCGGGFFLPSTASSAVSAVKILWTAAAAHV